MGPRILRLAGALLGALVLACWGMGCGKSVGPAAADRADGCDAGPASDLGSAGDADARRQAPDAAHGDGDGSARPDRGVADSGQARRDVAGSSDGTAWLDVSGDLGRDGPGEDADGCVCREGPCCDGCRFRPAGTPCDESAATERGCAWGVRCGSDVGERRRARLCTGESAACDGALGDPGPWWKAEDCQAPAGCVAGGCAPTATCEGARCPAAACPLVEGVAGVCNVATGHCEYAFSPLTDEWVLLRPGTFEMGPAEDELDANPSWRDPRHPVTLTRPFLMRTTELTRREWLAVIGGDHLHPEVGEYPFLGASWWDSLAYCNRLSELEGLKPCYELVNCTRDSRRTPALRGARRARRVVVRVRGSAGARPRLPGLPAAYGSRVGVRLPLRQPDRALHGRHLARRPVRRAGAG